MPPDFREVVETLRSQYGAAEPAVTDPLQIILWETVAYLADDTRRAQAFAALRDRVGLLPEEIASAPLELLRGICGLGGIHADLRGDRLRTIAEIALSQFGGDLSRATGLPLPQARKALRLFPSVGEPGADKILLISGAYPLPALESNGLRVLLRLGYAAESGNYTADYRAVQRSLEGQYPADCEWLTEAHLLLRHHGQVTCRRNHPECPVCPLRTACAAATQPQ